MRRRFLPIKDVPAIQLGAIEISLNRTWLVVLPVGSWAIVTFFIPLFGSFLNPVDGWLVTALIAVLIGLSLIAHVLGHGYAARLLGSTAPPVITLFLFGDAAQGWRPAGSTRSEVLVTVAGPLVNVLIAGLAYLLWNAQLNTYLNLSMLFVCGFNLWLVIINATPAFPLDGARLVRAVLPDRARWQVVARRLGLLVALVLVGWGIVLLAQRSSLSLPTGAATILFGFLLLTGQWLQPAWKPDAVEPADPGLPHRPLRTLLASLLTFVLLVISGSLLLLNEGIEAPGLALAVEPMVRVDPPHRFSYSGSFILTSVLVQAPITAGEWLLAQVSPAVKIVPVETVVPENTTPQDVARQGFQMLDESTTTAEVVGLRLAGYKADLVGKGVEVVGFQPDSLAQGPLESGDVITGLNGQTTRTTSDLIAQIKALNAGAPVNLTIQRNQHPLDVTVRLLPPAGSSPAPRLGIQIQPAGFDVQLPFPVQITPEKIVGGPSAGLMFTLTVLNLITPQDLTGGRKIAGTGTIALDGTVGPIGGVEQKVAAAEAAGAAYFLAPVENYDAARAVARHIQVVRVATAAQAVDFLRSLPSP